MKPVFKAPRGYRDLSTSRRFTIFPKPRISGMLATDRVRSKFGFNKMLLQLLGAPGKVMRPQKSRSSLSTCTKVTMEESILPSAEQEQS
jgi:hypothetical protein